MYFDDLWEISKELRDIFVLHGITSMLDAYQLWSDRFPTIEWKLCGIDGCERLVLEGEHCIKHIEVLKQLPTWQWQKGMLYRLIRKRIDTDKYSSSPVYEWYLQHVCERELGPLGMGYEPHRIDGNFMNNHPQNIVILSYPMKAAVDAGRISVEDALEVDRRIGDIVGGRNHRPTSVALIRHKDLAKATGLSRSGIRSAINRGRIDMKQPESVLEFVVNKRLEKVGGRNEVKNTKPIS